LSLGALALMDTLRETSAPWYRLNVELVQPVCWSNPEAFFRVDTPKGHDSVVNPRSICYMLSRNTVDGYVARHQDADLLAAGTFFPYLLGRSRTTPEATGDADRRHPPATVRSTSMPRATRALLPFCLQAIVDIRPDRVLDLDL